MNWSYTHRLQQILRDLLPDRIIVERQFLASFGRKPNLRHPKTLNEKLQWLKLYYRPPLLTQLTDKYAVRKYVAERAGGGILNECHGVWTKAETIDPAVLPDRFVLKATHGCGWNIFCRNKNALAWPAVRRQLRAWLKTKFYSKHREWAYKNIPPRVICEHLLEDKDGQPPPDYKFYCFDGVPRLIQVDMDRFGDHRRNYYNLDWEQLPIGSGGPNYPHEIARPTNLDQLMTVARQLTQGLPFCRADLYTVCGRVIFGELTLYSGAGLVKWEPESFDYLLGDYLRLPKRC